MKKTIINIFMLSLLVSLRSSAEEIYSAVSVHTYNNYYRYELQEIKKTEKICSEQFKLCKNENVSLLIEGELANLPANILDFHKDETSGLETFKIVLPDGRIEDNVPGTHLCGSKEVCLNDEILIKVINNYTKSNFFVLAKSADFDGTEIVAKTLKLFASQNQLENISTLKVDPQLVAKSVLCIKEFCIGDNKLYKQFEALKTGWKILRFFDNNMVEVMIESTSYLINLDTFFQSLLETSSTFKLEEFLNLRRLPLYPSSP